MYLLYNVHCTKQNMNIATYYVHTAQAKAKAEAEAEEQALQAHVRLAV